MKLNKTLILVCLLCLGLSLAFAEGRIKQHHKNPSRSNSFHKRRQPNAPAEGGAQAAAGAAGAGGKINLPDALSDRNGDGQSDYQEFSSAFQSSGLSQQQIKYIFQLVDKNKDNNVGRDEWATFVQIFLRPYKKLCKADQNPELTLQQVTECIKADTNMPFTGLDKSKLAENVFDALDKDRQKSKFNFMDYIFLRRAHLAWKNCAVDGRLSLEKMECGLHITQGQNFPVSRRLFLVGQMLFKGTLNETAFMDFGTFLHVAHVYYYFWNFQPSDGQHLSWREILNGLREQALPLYIQPDTVSQMFLSVDPSGNQSEVLDFANFITLISLYRRFERNCVKKQDSLAQEEFLKILAEPTFNQDLISIMNSTVIPTLEEVNRAMSLKRRPKATEEDYLINFLEMNRKHHKQSRFGRHKKQPGKAAATPAGAPNKGKAVPAATIPVANRPPNNMSSIVYGIFSPSGQDSMRFVDFVSFIKYGWAFIQFDSNRDGYVSVPELQSGLSNYYSPISLNKVELKKLGELVQNEQDTYINLKEFLDYMNYDSVFAPLLVPGNPRHVIESALKNGLSKLNLQLTEDVTDASRESNVAVSQPVFNYDKASVTAIFQDIEAVRQIRIGFEGNSTSNASTPAAPAEAPKKRLY